MMKKYWPMIAAIIMLLLIVGVCYQLSVKKNDGHFIYALDDAYIHMAMAKNIIQQGVWGVTKFGFTSSSSSMLWTSLMSLVYLISGMHEISPFVINILIGVALLIMLSVILKKYKLHSRYIFLALLCVLFVTPLPAVIFCGLEHVLHLLLSILVMYLAASILSKNESDLRDYLYLAIMVPVLVMTRYEGLFLVFAVCVLFLLKRSYRYSMLLGGLAFLPVCIYGLISVAKGWFFLPNSIVLKGNMPDLLSIGSIIAFFGENGLGRISANPHILILILMALGVFLVQFGKQRTIWNDSLLMLFMFIVTTVLHMQFADTGWFYRYEAYLVGLGIVVLFIALREYLPERRSGKFQKTEYPRYIAAVLFILCVILPFSERTKSLVFIPQATHNIYEQQYHMGLFLQKYYKGKAVAANDIGAINYLADINCLDLWGLGSMETARAIRDNTYNPSMLNSLAQSKGVDIAVMYESFFYQTGGKPPEWTKIHEWWISDNIVCGSNVVSFYTVNPSAQNELVNNLRAFEQIRHR